MGSTRTFTHTDAPLPLDIMVCSAWVHGEVFRTVSLLASLVLEGGSRVAIESGDHRPLELFWNSFVLDVARCHVAGEDGSVASIRVPGWDWIGWYCCHDSDPGIVFEEDSYFARGNPSEEVASLDSSWATGSRVPHNRCRSCISLAGVGESIAGSDAPPNRPVSVDSTAWVDLE